MAQPDGAIFVTFYTKDYFCPIDFETKELVKTTNTHTIHWFAGSWTEKPKFWTRVKMKIKSCARKILGRKNYEKLKNKLKGNKKWLN